MCNFYNFLVENNKCNNCQQSVVARLEVRPPAEAGQGGVEPVLAPQPGHEVAGTPRLLHAPAVRPIDRRVDQTDSLIGLGVPSSGLSYDEASGDGLRGHVPVIRFIWREKILLACYRG